LIVNEKSKQKQNKNENMNHTTPVRA
jgi:hypothetical protein